MDAFKAWYTALFYFKIPKSDRNRPFYNVANNMCIPYTLLSHQFYVWYIGGSGQLDGKHERNMIRFFSFSSGTFNTTAISCNESRLDLAI